MESTEKAHPISLLGTRSEGTFWRKELYPNYLKRFFDLLLSVLLLPLAIPILAVMYFMIKLDSKGPVLYKSERMGKDGKKFYIYKFRTMVLDAEAKLTELLEKNPELKREWEIDHKLRKDPRVTRVGKIIRALSLDELPQLWNVAKGEMSFVGPRPIVEAEVQKYGKYFRIYKSVKPGITGLWQVNGRNDISYEARINFDKHYVEKMSFPLDLLIMGKTIPVALSKKGAY
ncbi:lipid carrier--UDP-N-acetylgalactosaminyltransferase [Deltaproteobacteria bacterium PRO3]|nr:lipid carrier--UDP-N-acetylgalactosaminyltransferase [Deltaproteobacteria bacterium PRO3]